MSRIAGCLALLCLLSAPPPAESACTITGNSTLNCDGTTYQAVDDECVHYVNLAEHNAVHPGVPLPTLHKTVAANYAAGAIPAPVVVALTDTVDCTLTDHNFSHVNIVPSLTLTIGGQTFNTNPHPNKPSRLMTISGKSFRVTAAPDDGFATYYYSYDVATGGTAGVPHLLVGESSNDQERYTTLIVHHPDFPLASDPNGSMPAWNTYEWAPPYAGQATYNPWGDPWYNVNGPRTQQGPVFAPDVGLTTYTGRELAIDNQPFNINLIFHPKSTVARVVVSSLGCNLTRTSNDGGAVSRLWVFKFVDAMSSRYPQIAALPNPALKRRLFGVHMTHPWYLYAHHGTPVATLQNRQADLQRFVQHLTFCGMNLIAFNAVNGADRSEKAWYSGSAFFNWNSAGDLLAELPPIAQAEGIQLIPIITSIQATATNHLSLPSEAYQMNTNGNTTKAFGNPTLDPLRPEVQGLVYSLLSEIASRTATQPSVRGIGLRINGKIGTCYTAHEDGQRGARLSGYSTWDLQQFKNATGSGVPTSPPGTAYSWLVARPTEWEAWINWRCQKTRQMWLGARDLIQSVRSDLVLYLMCDLPSEVPGTNIEWPSGETPYNLLRYHGYDPNMFVNDTGIVITRGMMVAEDRFYVSTRWNAPFGSNYNNYRLFHFATGLPELYRSLEGRACDFYQNYWEEARNPYYEYGSPTDPAGYFRTTTPAAFGRHFFAPAIMSVRRQDPDTMTWLGWCRPTLGHETELRKFAQAFRALPAVTATPFAGTLLPNLPNEVVARWHDQRLAVINDSSTTRTITLNFTTPYPEGHSLTDAVTGHILIPATGGNRSSASFSAEAYSLNTFLPSPELQPIPGDFDGDSDVDQADFGRFQSCISGDGIIQSLTECQGAHFDGDTDVDEADLAIFLACMQGADLAGDPLCADP